MMRGTNVRCLLLSISLCAGLGQPVFAQTPPPPPNLATAKIVDLADGRASTEHTRSLAVSNGGLVVVGERYDYPGNNYQIFRWTACSGWATLPGPANTTGENLVRMSDDGTVVIGQAGLSVDPFLTHYRWTADGGVETMPTDSAFAFATASGTIYGALDTVWHDVNNPPQYTPFYWKPHGSVTVINPSANITGTGLVDATPDDSTLLLTGYRNDNVSPANCVLLWRPATGAVQYTGIDASAFPGQKRLSKDGSTIIGQCAIPSANRLGLFRWTSGGGLTYLPLPTTWRDLTIDFMSKDGTTVVGTYELTTNGEQRLFHWNIVSGIQEVATPNGSPLGHAVAISEDGSVAAGIYTATIDGLNYPRSFRWTAASGPLDIGVVPGNIYTFVTGVNKDGSILIGTCQGDAFIWTADLGIVKLQSYLSSQGVSGSWSALTEANAFTPDGAAIVGVGFTPYVFNGTYFARDAHAYTAQLYPDKDQDAIPDEWEVNGIPYYDHNCNEKRYVLKGANPLKKDLFVEIDAMAGHAPKQAAINRVVAAFNTPVVPAPSGLAGGLPGITLHAEVDSGDQNIMSSTLGLVDPSHPDPMDPQHWIREPFVDFDRIKNENNLGWGFGTDRERTNIPADWPMIRTAKAQVYRYCLFADKRDGDTVSGESEIGGNDFYISLGGWANGTEDEQAGTFMHELGHTLGLHHGGGDDINYKPNYYSIMNYEWQVPDPNLASTFQLRYSEEVLPTLDEHDLDENLGIGANFPNRFAHVSTPIRYASMALGASVDWNGNRAPDSHVSIDINNLDGSNSLDVLQGYNDWQHLQYGFRGSPDFADGSSTTASRCTFDVATMKMLHEQKPVCAIDIGVAGGLPGIDGILDNNDSIVFYSWYFAQDLRADFGKAGGLPGSDGVIDSNDQIAFINLYFAGCN